MGGPPPALPGLASRPFPLRQTCHPPNPTGGAVPCQRSCLLGGGGGGHTALSLSLQMPPRSHPSPRWCSPGGGVRPSCSAPPTASRPPTSSCTGGPATRPSPPRGARPTHASPSRRPPTPCGWGWGGWSCGTRGSTSARPTTATAPRPRPCAWTWEVRAAPSHGHREPWVGVPVGPPVGVWLSGAFRGIGGMAFSCARAPPDSPGLPPPPQGSRSQLSPRQKSPRAPQPL